MNSVGLRSWVLFQQCFTVLAFFCLTGFKDAFYKYTFDEADVQGFKYDLTSIMHYENTAFTNGYCRPTMLVKKDPSYEVTPVYLRKFSPQDIQKINKLYSCQTNQLPPTGKTQRRVPIPSSTLRCQFRFRFQSWFRLIFGFEECFPSAQESNRYHQKLVENRQNIRVVCDLLTRGERKL